LAFLIGYKAAPSPDPAPVYYKTDTVHVAKVYHDTVTITKAMPPQTVTIYLPDTARRTRLEAGTIVSGVKTSRNGLEVETIDPKGVVEIKAYPLQGLPEIQISPMGAVSITPLPPPSKPRRLAWFAAGAATVLLLLTVR
jgi:hypothetical protein